MVGRKAVVDGSIVENVILADDDFAIPGKIIVALVGEAPVAKGWTYEGGEFSPPPEIPVVITSVTMRQARLALLYAGLIGPIEAAMDALPEPHRSAAKVEWEFATSLRRDHPLIATLAAALELTQNDVDTLFLEASQIV